MSTNGNNPFEAFLNRHDEEAWSHALADLLPSIHEVDRNATEIWFAFFPLSLQRALQQAEDPARLAQKLLLQGRFYLKQQIDSSHKFLYGHRYWPQVKRAVVERAEKGAAQAELELSSLIRDIAGRVSSALKIEASLVLGITAVALMTLQQVGLEHFKATPGEVLIDRAHAARSPQQVLKERTKDNSQGVFKFLRTTDKRWTVTFDENERSARFPMVNMQEIASAAPNHPLKDWSAIDPRCTVDEGPIPVQCRSASCGTCWVGVLGGAEKLTDVSLRERRVMKQFGYIDTDSPRPLIRLSCQAQGAGAVSIVIPPWNGVFGKYLSKPRDGETDETESPAAEVEAQA